MTTEPKTGEADAYPAVPAPPASGKLVAVTVRLDPGRYEKLKLYGLKRRLTNQQILVQALDLVLAVP